MKLFGLILTYNCENLIENTIKKIPFKKFDRVLCVDDGSSDKIQKKLKNYNINFLSIFLLK
jgi:glycosyltransferase involved in cell wall biosynthesis